MKKVIRLTETDLARIVKRALNENVNQTVDEFGSSFKRVSYALDDYKNVLRTGDSRKIDEAKDIVKFNIRRLENIIEQLKRML